MATPARRAAASQPPPGPEVSWTPDLNPAMTALLDHLAEELALEYVRLMAAAAEVSLHEGEHQED